MKIFKIKEKVGILNLIHYRVNIIHQYKFCLKNCYNLLRFKENYKCSNTINNNKNLYLKIIGDKMMKKKKKFIIYNLYKLL